MSNIPPNIQLSDFSINARALQTAEEMLSYIESIVDKEKVEIQTCILNLKNELNQLKIKKNKRSGMIHATADDLRTAFNRHYDAVQRIEEICSHLLLFYAVECGLKSILLKRRKLKGTEQLDDSFLSHDFAPLIKELRLPPKVVGDISHLKTPNFRLHRDNSSWSMSEIHQSWRYGVRVHLEDEPKVVEWLNNLCVWIKENLNR